MSNLFRACHGCTREWKHPGCHDTCKDYKAEKAAFDEQKAASDARRKINNEIYSQKSAGIHRARRKHRK